MNMYRRHGVVAPPILHNNVHMTGEDYLRERGRSGEEKNPSVSTMHFAR
jgi:hypothetical protein